TTQGVRTMRTQHMHLRLATVGALAIALFATTPARAHEDPAGCFETGPAIIVSVFRSDGVTGVVGSVSECETIRYRATLQKANDLDSICAFSGGTFSLTTPDGVVHTIDSNVPCIGGNTGLEGCLDAVNNEISPQFPYTVSPADVVGGLITATATYAGGVAHDSPLNTAGVGATTPKSTPVVFCNDNNNCTIDVCDPAASGSGACSNTPVVCDDNNGCTTDACNPANGQCVFTPLPPCDDQNGCTTDTCNPATGQCVFTPNAPCDDNNGCTTDSCNPATGQCVFTPNAPCDDNNACTTDTCNPATGQCVFTPNAPCDDNHGCTTDTCDPATGQCVFTPKAPCDDNNGCTTDTCNPATGQCVFTPNAPC